MPPSPVATETDNAGATGIATPPRYGPAPSDTDPTIAIPIATTATGLSAQPIAEPSQRSAVWGKPWIRYAALIVGALLLLGVGSAVGARSANSERDKYNKEVATERSTETAASAAAARASAAASKASSAISALQSQLDDEKLQAQAALNRAKGAEAAAVKDAKAKLASQSAALDGRKKAIDAQAAAVAQREAAVAAAEGQLKANTISGDGVYGVGTDMQPGTWHTNGSTGCYYAILNSTDTSDIADNNNTNGPATVTLSAGKYFEVSGCADWTKIG